jgi:putative transposase
MANTYSQVYIQIVFSVKNRQSLINDEWKEDLFKFICGIINNLNCKPIAVNGVGDHLHVLIGLKPSLPISELVQKIKANSSRWITENNFVKGKFEWQSGYGVFSYSHSQLTKVINYIKKQEEHHSIKSFNEEYIEFLKAFEIDYDKRYIFKEIEE